LTSGREADRAKLKAYSGEESVKKSPEAQVPPPTSEHVTETTPLLKSNATPSFASKKQHTWRSVSLAVLGGAEVIGRVAVFAHTVLEIVRGNASPKQLATPIIFLVAWVYATLKPIARPRPTVPYGILAVHLFSLLSSLGVFYLWGLKLDDQRQLSPASLILHVINGFITFFGICIIMSMPIHANVEPTVDEDGLSPAKDDFVTLYQWLTFNWMSKFVAIGAERSVEESDIWQLSSLLRARVVMSKFRHFKRKTLLRRVLAANALDLSIDFVFTVSQPVFNQIL
jgi:hypothetical protein